MSHPAFAALARPVTDGEIMAASIARRSVEDGDPISPGQMVVFIGNDRVSWCIGVVAAIDQTEDHDRHFEIAWEDGSNTFETLKRSDLVYLMDQTYG